MCTDYKTFEMRTIMGYNYAISCQHICNTLYSAFSVKALNPSHVFCRDQRGVHKNQRGLNSPISDKSSPEIIYSLAVGSCNVNINQYFLMKPSRKSHTIDFIFVALLQMTPLNVWLDCLACPSLSLTSHYD